MKLNKIVQALVIGSSIILLSGCAAKHSAGYNNMNGGGAGGVQTSGLGENENFGSDGMAGGAHRMANNNTYYFDYDSNQVHPQDKASIETHANRLASSRKGAVVEGHTDPRGSREYNIALGERRANAVAELMKSRGVNPSQVRVVSYGSQRPASAGQSEQDYQLDRRAVIEGKG